MLRPANEITSYAESHAPSHFGTSSSDFSHSRRVCSVETKPRLSRSPDLTDRHSTASVSFCPLSARRTSTSLCRAHINSYNSTGLHLAAPFGCHGVQSCKFVRLICTFYYWSHYGYSVCPCWCNILATLGVVVCNNLWTAELSLSSSINSGRSSRR